MSVKLTYGKDSDTIESLPTTNDMMSGADYGKILPLIQDGEKIVQHGGLQRYIYLLVILVAIMYSNPLLLRFKPKLDELFNGHLIIVLKCAIFMVVLYTVDNFNILKLN